VNGRLQYAERVVIVIGEYPHLRDAEKAADALRNTINTEFTVPETVAELITHYRTHELTEDKKAYATVEANTHYLTNRIAPKWGDLYLSDIRTVDVESWLHTLQYAPGTRSKIRNIMSAVFNHAIRHEWMDRNPITKVRVSAKRLREPDVLSPAEIASLIAVLDIRERAMVMLAGSTGLRRSELVALAPFFHGISNQSETLPIFRHLRIELHLEVLRNTDPKVTFTRFKWNPKSLQETEHSQHPRIP
jgi:hypothetical protein